MDKDRGVGDMAEETGAVRMEVDSIYQWLRQPENADCLDFLTRDDAVNYKDGRDMEAFWRYNITEEQAKILWRIYQNMIEYNWEYISMVLQILWRRHFNADFQFKWYGTQIWKLDTN